ncbi:hypothetical protein [Paenibacillus xylanilyticus]|uniref:Uncharacterized protein n=1 Tax=Paenibacillus xylanilyticus TaxID=248903 RepID=A0A7Y6BSE2_9BACL|nr:hypothetical protein [Paenibacillus xylanilyticus]NUU74100.1 hypothetical protein [Paenibacillus xylanilyticus]
MSNNAPTERRCLKIKAYRTDEEFEENCPCAFEIYDLVNSIKDTDVQWFLDVAFFFPNEQKYIITFKSYDTPEYNDYSLGISAQKNDSGAYDLTITGRVDNLLA